MCGAALLAGAAACFGGPKDESAPKTSKIAPATMAKVGTIDERFQSYNIETVEVTGGRFWKPFASIDKMSAEDKGKAPDITAPGGMNPSLYEYRAPIDLGNARLRKLAAALGPAYVRVSGTWMNSTYFQDTDAPAPATPPAGFNSVMTRAQWKGVVDFSRAVDAKIVTSFSTSAGTRDAAAIWTPDQAKKFAAYTMQVGGSLAATEFMNEPTFATMGGAPKGYDAAAYAKDYVVFKQFARADLPGMVILGPGGVGEGGSLIPPQMAAAMHLVKTEDILALTGPAFDAFSYHSYGGASSRCGRGMGGTTSESALTDEWLAKPGQIEAYYAGIRDKQMPGKAIWLTETAQTACGGDRWASTFLDSFRYLNQLGSLAKLGVQVHMHNTLASSDYGLLDEKTYDPRPNYWAALLWRRLMGTTVLEAGVQGAGPSPATNLHLYAQCMRSTPGGVTLLAINADKNAAQTLSIPTGAERYTLTSNDLMSQTVELNGTELKLGSGDALPRIKGKATKAGDVSLAPASITFLAFEKAGNESCR